MSTKIRLVSEEPWCKKDLARVMCKSYLQGDYKRASEVLDSFYDNTYSDFTDESDQELKTSLANILNQMSAFGHLIHRVQLNQPEVKA